MKSKGFTLLEVMVALAIFAVAAVALNRTGFIGDFFI
ncbi:prepilin-type N-terminal cleavage/methylation domain-containing protein, partial [Acinetobacter baumannii]